MVGGASAFGVGIILIVMAAKPMAAFAIVTLLGQPPRVALTVAAGIAGFAPSREAMSSP